MVGGLRVLIEPGLPTHGDLHKIAGIVYPEARARNFRPQGWAALL